MPKYRRGSGSIYRRGKTWWLSYYTKTGQHICESAKTKDKNVARKKLKVTVGQLEEDRLVIGADRVTFEDLVAGVEDDYITNDRKSVPRLEESSPRAGFFEQAEFEAVAKHLPTYLQAPMTFAYLTGWRCRSEVLPLPWRNVDFEAGVIRLDVGTTKNKDGRVIYMTAALRALLEEQRQATLALQRETGQLVPLVFHNSGRPIANYYKAWHRACRAAGLSGKIPHDYRRTAVRNMVRAGIPEKVAMQMAGHKTRSVFDRYHIVSEGDLQDAARRLEMAFPQSTATVLATISPLAPSERAVSGRNS
jgi:integrase